MQLACRLQIARECFGVRDSWNVSLVLFATKGMGMENVFPRPMRRVVSALVASVAGRGAATEAFVFISALSAVPPDRPTHRRLRAQDRSC